MTQVVNINRSAFKSATIWSGLDRLFSQLLGFGISIALARLLAPAEFGVVAMMVVFTGLAGLFIDSGFSSALVQKQDVSAEQETAVFWFNIATAIFAAVSLGLAGPWIARFFDQPVLSTLAWISGGVLVINSLGGVHSTLLSKKMEFRQLMYCSLPATMVSGTVAVSLALKGAGIWALVAQQVSSGIVLVGMLWVISDWRPQGRFNPQALKPLFQFGGFMMLSGLLDRVYSNFTSILIGRLYSAADLGFYNRAMSTQQMPTGFVTGIVGRVTFPAFSSMDGDIEQLRDGVKKALQFLMLINIPMMLGLWVVADPLVLFLFGEKWAPSIKLLQVLCFAGLIFPMHVINLHVLMALGRSREFLRLEVVKKLLGFGVMLVAAMQGVMLLAWAQVALGVMSLLINTHYSGKLLNYGVIEQLRDLVNIAGAAIAMMLCVFLVRQKLLPDIPPSGQVPILIFTGVLFFCVLTWLFRLPGVSGRFVRGVSSGSR